MLVVFALALPARAAPANQVLYFTPTPGNDGRILYIVQAGESCLIIELKTGVKVETLRTLNNLDVDCTVREGQELLLGVVAAATQTPVASETPSGPSPTPFNGTGRICILLFDDINGNATRETTELPIAGGAISITDRIGKISISATTTQTYDAENEEYRYDCFEDIPEGDYNISVAPPEGYNATMNMNYPLTLKAGDNSQLAFGAQLGTGAITPPPGEGGRSPLMAIFGAFLILAGIGLGVYFFLLRRQNTFR